MKTISLKAEIREGADKRSLRELRKQEMVPGVIYHNAAATHIQLIVADLRDAIYTADTYIVNLEFDGKVISTIIREMQFHPVTDKLLHIDFLQVTDDKPVILQLPIELTGTPVGVAKGGKLAIKLRRLKVKGIPTQLPEKIPVDVSEVDLGGSIKVAEANITGVEVMTAPSAAIATVIIPRALRSAKAAEAK